MHSIETERLILRGLQETDVAPLTEMLASPRVTQWLFSGIALSSGDARAFIERHFTFGRSAIGIGVLREKETDRFVGFAGLLACRYLDGEDFEIGAAFMEDSWKKGYGVEVGRAQIAYGLEKLKLPRLLALAHPDNVNSIKVLEKLGMTFVKDVSIDERGPRCVYVVNRAERSGIPFTKAHV
jgi:ribosomal-protein-alanine N-acetyltransferase